MNKLNEAIEYTFGNLLDPNVFVIAYRNKDWAYIVGCFISFFVFCPILMGLYLLDDNQPIWCSAEHVPFVRHLVFFVQGVDNNIVSALERFECRPFSSAMMDLPCFVRDIHREFLRLKENFCTTSP